MERELLRRFIARYRHLWWIAIGVSVLLNIVLFGGTLYVILLYDSVLPSGSIPTLVGLLAMLTLLYTFQYVLELLRSETLLRMANNMYRDLVRPVHAAAVRLRREKGEDRGSLMLVRDLDQVHAFVSSAGSAALLDLPWVPLFLLLLFALHWGLGLTALVGAAILCVIAWITNRAVATKTDELQFGAARRNAAVQNELGMAETATALGMQKRLFQRHSLHDSGYLSAQVELARTSGRFGSAGRVLRQFLQSIIMSVGALLVLEGQASGGVMIASSVLFGRALAPVDVTIANGRNLAAARQGWARIVRALLAYPAAHARGVSLEPPTQKLALRDIWVAPPGSDQPILKGVSMELAAGQAVALIGPSGAGKSTMGRAMLGIWPAGRGEVTLDGARHDQWDGEAIGAAMGYLPQTVELIDGTIGENIARFDPQPSSNAIIAAARMAGVHDLILTLAQGYDTPVSAMSAPLSAGQKQLMGLARAIYGDPFLVVLDEPNSNLDADGDAALARAIIELRKRGALVVVVTHRPSVLQVISHVAMMRDGRLADFGERDAVLARMQKQGQPQGPGGGPPPNGGGQPPRVEGQA